MFFPKGVESALEVLALHLDQAGWWSYYPALIFFSGKNVPLWLSDCCCIFGELMFGKKTNWAKSCVSCFLLYSAKETEKIWQIEARVHLSLGEWANMLETSGWLNVVAGSMECYRLVKDDTSSFFHSQHWKWLLFQNPWWYSKMLEVTAGFLQSNIFNTTSKGTTMRFIFGSLKPLMNLRGQLRALSAT